MRMFTMLLAAACAVLAVGATAPARADWDGDAWRHPAWREHEWREHEWREHHVPTYYGYGYAPPPVYYYAPPPAVILHYR